MNRDSETLQRNGIDHFLITRREAAAHLRIGLTKLNQLLASGDIACIRIGRSVRISMRALQEYVHRLEGEKRRAA